jgi:hypothetical protein
MSKVRKKRVPLNHQAHEYLGIQREVQRVMLVRLRVEDFRRQIGELRATRPLMAAELEISAEHLGNLEMGKTPLSAEMRARFMAVCNVTPREWALREATILQELPIILSYPRRVESLVAEPPASYTLGSEEVEEP